ncbi:hypothetical protein H112_02785 [Trichophyton rubrum D6]|uniref:Uncharacterized protein n=3 Tax=Trichophyton TaxID=5550 RepID=F2SSG7_TRIRC|nr:uncharacterized protein TERG_05420 [Trichophyton rubrum CBS 118892]EZF24679.1 hypothetical protein H100_02792 [Trichophyton rubrum MR850]EZF43745.1 hypothetical protein H102_02784 [Trichophyton rubrum CBS 100081]EZF54338.1 hypothetical protein H103_02796 [Trichophyton rubrum CBS 288.86]EZF65029.1 hypothetical protein H104_02775 [Trichophyton rubrum CBS 289.86]EZF75606.1 hypothetical protein H105_02801 [Trichophyton soudanense CBS 452.61]EZF86236.1 hypothetical protein H110_02794 [Trichophy
MSKTRHQCFASMVFQSGLLGFNRYYKEYAFHEPFVCLKVRDLVCQACQQQELVEPSLVLQVIFQYIAKLSYHMILIEELLYLQFILECGECPFPIGPCIHGGLLDKMELVSTASKSLGNRFGPLDAEGANKSYTESLSPR